MRKIIGEKNMNNFTIYESFFSKRPTDVKNLLHIIDNNRQLCITFLNPYTIALGKNSKIDYSKFDYICSDAGIPLLLERIWGFFNTRISFDLGSFAKILFEYAQRKEKSIYFWGTSEENLQKACLKIMHLFPKLKISGKCNGFYQDQDLDSIIAKIMSCNPDFVIIGQGIPKQDENALRLRDSGYTGTVFTCGGFLHQTAMSNSGYYYPELINRLNLRAIYRLLHEKYIIKRLLLYYIPFVFTYQLFLFKKRKQLCFQKKDTV